MSENTKWKAIVGSIPVQEQNGVALITNEICSRSLSQPETIFHINFIFFMCFAPWRDIACLAEVFLHPTFHRNEPTVISNSLKGGQVKKFSEMSLLWRILCKPSLMTALYQVPLGYKITVPQKLSPVYLEVGAVCLVCNSNMVTSWFLRQYRCFLLRYNLKGIWTAPSSPPPLFRLSVWHFRMWVRGMGLNPKSPA